MRSFLLFICLLTLARDLRAQEQERKLIDRLLRPDLSLVNPAEGKQFHAINATLLEKQFVARRFSVGEERRAPRFAPVKDFLPKDFAAKKFSGAEASAHVEANAEVACTTIFQWQRSNLIRTSPEAKKRSPVNNYGDVRPFRGKGTRQEILSRQDHPLTIDQVRELLNKNR